MNKGPHLTSELPHVDRLLISNLPTSFGHPAMSRRRGLESGTISRFRHIGQTHLLISKVRRRLRDVHSKVVAMSKSFNPASFLLPDGGFTPLLATSAHHLLLFSLDLVLEISNTAHNH